MARSLLVTVAMTFSGGMIALVPASVQAAAARLFDAQAQADIALSLSVGAFVAAVVNAAVIEARLASPGLVPRTFIPAWLALIGVVAGLALVVAPLTEPVVLVAIPLFMTATLVSRTHAAVQGRWRSEAIGGVLLAAACVASFAFAFAGSDWAVRVLGVAVAVIVVIRVLDNTWRGVERAPFGNVAWVTAETATVAATQLVLTVVVYALLGPTLTVLFKMLSTVANVLEPSLSFLRTQLLSVRSTAVVASTSAVVLVGIAVIFVCDGLGVFRAYFGPVWTDVPIIAIIAACVWKVVTVFSTVPFAALRRAGSVRAVFLMRALSTVVYIAAGLVAVLVWRSVEAVFVSYVVAELATLLLFFVTERRLGARSAELADVQEARA